jgi:signal transduction histidine kinase
VAVVASIASAVLAWRNTRYVAHRIEQLAARRAGRAGDSATVKRASALLGFAPLAPLSPNETIDELDRIEHLVDRLSDALAESRALQAQESARRHERAREYATLVRSTADASVKELDEVRLPLHILLDNHFGELNENQEEMLGTASVAAEVVEIGLARLRDIARLDLDEGALRRDRVRLSDLVEGIVPSLQMEGEKRNVTVSVDIATPLAPVSGDRVRLQEALSDLLHDALSRTIEGGSLEIKVGTDSPLSMRVSGAEGLPSPAAFALAQRVVSANSGSIIAAGGIIDFEFAPSPLP